MNILKKIFGDRNKKEEIKIPPLPPQFNEQTESEVIQISEISPQELKLWLEQGEEIIIVDMRQKWEHETGHIPGAIHMFVQDIPARFHELPQNTNIVFQCWHGNTSLGASALLIEKGWSPSQVVSLAGGITGWVESFGQESLVADI